MENEKFSLAKFLDFSPVGWFKVAGLGLKVLVIVLLVFGVKFGIDKIFPPAPANVNKPEIHVASGGTANYTVVQQAEKKRPWWIPTPFVEIFGEMKTDEDHAALGGRTGARWDF